MDLLANIPTGASVPNVPSGPGQRGNGRGVYSTNTLNGFSARRPTPAPGGQGSIFLGYSPGPKRSFRDPGVSSSRSDDTIGRYKGRGSKREGSRAALLQEFDGTSIAMKKEAARLLALAGYLDLSSASDPGQALQNTIASATLSDVRDAYSALLEEAESRYTQDSLELTPQQLLMMNIEFRHGGKKGLDFDSKDASGIWDSATGGGSGGGSGGLGKPEDLSGTTTNTQKVRDIWNPKDARQLAEQTLQSILQRDPTQAEYEDFVAALRNEQKENPLKVTTSTTTDKEGGVIAQTTRNRGGVDPSTFAGDFAEDAPDHGDWQMMGTYWPAVLQALGSTVPGT